MLWGCSTLLCSLMYVCRCNWQRTARRHRAFYRKWSERSGHQAAHKSKAHGCSDQAHDSTAFITQGGGSMRVRGKFMYGLIENGVHVSEGGGSMRARGKCMY